MNELYNDSSYLIPYFKQYKLLLNNNKILDYSKNKSFIYNNLKEVGFDVYQDNLNQIYDGIVINNIDRELNEDLFINLNKILKDDGLIFVIMHLKHQEKCFDDEEESVEISSLKDNIKDYFSIKTELPTSASWKFIIIEKNTSK